MIDFVVLLAVQKKTDPLLGQPLFSIHYLFLSTQLGGYLVVSVVFVNQQHKKQKQTINWFISSKFNDTIVCFVFCRFSRCVCGLNCWVAYLFCSGNQALRLHSTQEI